MIKKYGECLNKKIYSQRHIAINPPQNSLPRFEHTFHIKQFWKSSFVSVSSCGVVAASMSWID